jgi:hypothetical protein
MPDTINDVIIPALINDTATKAIVSNRAYWVKPPGENYTWPFLTVIESSDSESDYADDEESESTSTYAVEIFSKDNFRNLQSAVVQAMKGLGYTRETGPDEWIPELKCYHKSINFRK